jgi:hypothetical protein
VREIKLDEDQRVLMVKAGFCVLGAIVLIGFILALWPH